MQHDDGGAPQSGPYLVCCCSFTSADSTLLFFTFLTAALLQWFSQMKEQLPDLFSAWLLCLDRASCWDHLQQDVGLVVTAVNNTCLTCPALTAIMRFSYHKEVFLQEMFSCLFVVFKHIHFLQCKQYSNILGWGGESASVVCSWRWHSMLWYSNGVIHQQALLKHLDKPAEATPVAMVTILKVDVCSQTVAAKIFNTIDMDLLICLHVCIIVFIL